MIRTNFSWATEPCIVAVIPQLFTIHFFFLLVHGSLADRVPEGLPSDDTYVCLVLAIDAHAIKASPCFLFFFLFPLGYHRFPCRGGSTCHLFIVTPGNGVRYRSFDHIRRLKLGPRL